MNKWIPTILTALYGICLLVYVLGLEGGNYYVGTTKDLARRLKQHLAGVNSAWWTRLHAPISTIEIREVGYTNYGNAYKHENLVTLEYVDRYGIELVRGGFITSAYEDEAAKQLELARRVYAPAAELS